MGAADDQFVREHEHQVVSIARRVVGQLDLQVEIEDLVAYGMQGLIEARDRFDASRGVPFPAFAHYRIRGAILDGVRRMARLPRKVHARRRAAETLDAMGEGALEARAAEPGDAAASLRAIDEILGRTSAAFVLAALGQAEDTAPEGEDKAIESEQREWIARAIHVLDERERALIEAIYYRDETLEEAGKGLGISKSWASRVHKAALERLRIALRASR